MAKNESSVGGLVSAFALVAGVLSGTLLRTSGPVEQTKPTSHAPASVVAHEQVVPEGASLADLKPVMELIAESIGVSIEPDRAILALRPLLAEVGDHSDRRSRDVANALTQLKAFLSRPDQPDVERQSAFESAAIVDGYLRSDINPEARFHKLRSQVTEKLLEEFTNEDALQKLTEYVGGTRSPSMDVRFLLATIPDYVDSNSGWVADETIGAIQSAMSHAGFVLDRFKLIDWSRVDDARTDRVANDSRLHERQPGAIIFRKVDTTNKLDARDHDVTLQVVLLVLETPTTGVHRRSLANAIDFVHRWECKIGHREKPQLRVVGPMFSGSIPSLALEFKASRGKFDSVSMVTGAAMVDDNRAIVQALAGQGVTYESVVAPTPKVMAALSRTLGAMNSDWRVGEHVALLVESNTSFGQAATVAVATSKNADGTDNAAKTCPSFRGRVIEGTFPCAVVYPFPLHVAQLRSDATLPATGTIPLLPSPIVPLNFKDTTPASDQLPALRPQLTSPVVEATVANILDNIRHENLTAVGIVATDSRDVMFLAREVKKAFPDVQLFFMGSYLLYLEPEYIPYTRGAIVGSPYSLSLGTQSDTSRRAHATITRETFPSFIATGVFNATSLLLGKTDQLIDYCEPTVSAGESTVPCAPPVWSTVIGNDGYWPLEAAQNEADVVRTVEASRPAFQQLPTTTVGGLIARRSGTVYRGGWLGDSTVVSGSAPSSASQTAKRISPRDQSASIVWSSRDTARLHGSPCLPCARLPRHMAGNDPDRSVCPARRLPAFHRDARGDGDLSDRLGARRYRFPACLELPVRRKRHHTVFTTRSQPGIEQDRDGIQWRAGDWRNRLLRHVHRPDGCLDATTDRTEDGVRGEPVARGRDCFTDVGQRPAFRRVARSDGCRGTAAGHGW